MIHDFLPLWPAGLAAEPDTYVAFRARFDLPETGSVDFLFTGASWFTLWLDGVWFAEGPTRYARGHTEHQVLRRTLAAGPHVLAVQLHHDGVETRMLPDLQPFFACAVNSVAADAAPVPLPLAWRAIPLPAYHRAVRRMSPQFGWIEWCDTREVPADWIAPAFDDVAWPVCSPAIDAVPIASDRACLAEIDTVAHALAPLAAGEWAETYGYEKDDPALRFFLRDLECVRLPAQGVWRRYDLGRVRLFRPAIELDLPPGTVVEFGYAEALSNGRVPPFINWSLGPSSHIDHYVARGGRQLFAPMTPRGGRFLEVHVRAPFEQVRWCSEKALERVYHGTPEGKFSCDDALIDRIWMTGVETYRACSEDAVTDNPTRERGQWLGDALAVGLRLAAVAYSDLRLFRRAIVQAAQCAGPKGQVAGLSPGSVIYLPTFAAQWVEGVLDYHRLTGERGLLRELWPALERNLGEFVANLGDDGIASGWGWMFVDWPYAAPKDGIDPAMNLMALQAFTAARRWAALLGEPDAFAEPASRLRAALERWWSKNATGGDYAAVGFQVCSLALAAGLVEPERESAVVDYLCAHIADCFPNRPDAPRLVDMGSAHPRMITPAFLNGVLPILIERGRMPFVLAQYRSCWGWCLDQGLTTWPEVFETRWSHCHQWAGAPTWQLSRYGLGLHARADLGPGVFDFWLEPGDLEQAGGALPLPGGGLIEIEWRHVGDDIDYRLRCPAPLVLRRAGPRWHLPEETQACGAGGHRWALRE